MPRRKNNISSWALILAIIITGIAMFGVGSFRAILGSIVGWLCGWKCYQWAIKAKKKGTSAFLVGFFFGLIGLLLVWLVYRKYMSKS